MTQDLELSRLGHAAFASGDGTSARHYFEQAVAFDRRNARHRYNLAIVLEKMGEPAEAARHLTTGLKLDPTMLESAERLSLLARQPALLKKADLDPAGLQAALAFPTIDRESVASLALRWLLARDPLRAIMRRGAAEGWLPTARGLCSKATAPILVDPLLLTILRSSINLDPAFEQLLTALRRVIALDLDPGRFGDGKLVELVVALAEQCRANEYVWLATPEERVAVQQAVTTAANSRDATAWRIGVLRSAAYLPLHHIVGLEFDPTRLAGEKVRSLAAAIQRSLEERHDELERTARLRASEAIVAPISQKVAAQYEANPYPRWTSLSMLVSPDAFRSTLGAFYAPAKLAFMDGSFEVLVAGCGTGQQAISAAKAYGPAARIIGVDLSAESIAYASRMAEQLGVTNLELVHGDLLELCASADFQSRFKVVECCGVLHHMEDLFQGWRALLRCLAPGGLMCIAVYSALARRNLAALRQDPDYPGSGCSDDALRRFRATLMLRRQGERGAELLNSRDFYTTSGFRDLTLHVSEHCTSLNEIEHFMRGAGLSFRGFQFGGYFDLLRRKFPQERWPGGLLRWAELEEENPELFTRMYQFWCDRG